MSDGELIEGSDDAFKLHNITRITEQRATKQECHLVSILWTKVLPETSVSAYDTSNLDLNIIYKVLN